ncbi:MAG: isocitrate/isopropylmalate family dehydrogenase [Bryobacteraceae bacterium]
MNRSSSLLSYLNVNGPVAAASVPLIGVFRGCGIGPSLIEGTIEVLQAAADVLGTEIRLEYGGAIAEESLDQGGPALPEGAAAFCADIFRRGGAILSGPGGGRYVYDLRRRFDLFCKFVPVRPVPELARAAKLVPGHLADIDILIVRDNIGGVYQGTWSDNVYGSGRVASHQFEYDEADVRRLAQVAVRAAAGRRGGLQIVLKDHGVPAISALWRGVCADVASDHDIRPEFINVDFAAYELIQHPARFDVILAPNLFGDILADIAGVLMSSRGVTFSGNFDCQGHAIYQTNHGCAHDLSGSGTANPGGQILSLVMLLRESFGMSDLAGLIERSLLDVWAHGWRTSDVAEPGSHIAGTRAFIERVMEQIPRSLKNRYDADCITVG